MSKLQLVWIILLIVWAGWLWIDPELPQIKLNKEFQHKTIGELPIVEMADDGAFAEIDGMERQIDISSVEKAIDRVARGEIHQRNKAKGVGVMIGQCKYYLKGKELQQCIDDIKSLEYIKGAPRCDDLEKVGEKYNMGVCYTCWGGWVQ